MSVSWNDIDAGRKKRGEVGEGIDERVMNRYSEILRPKHTETASTIIRYILSFLADMIRLW